MMTTQQALNSARLLANWNLQNQRKDVEADGTAGSLLYSVSADKTKILGAADWNVGFAMMGMLSAGKVFQEPKYLDSARKMALFLRTLQEFSPFFPEYYGAFREATPQTIWSYVRDALSAAWACLSYYEVTGNREFLERAKLWGEWFLKHGLDETGWPIWGNILEEREDVWKPEMHLELHGCFHGGSLNFFYHLARLTGDQKWVGPFYEHIADYFVDHIQQSDGYFRSIDKKTKQVPPEDPQAGLHRGNDDLGTLGLLGAWKIFGKQKYLTAIEKFLKAVFEHQQPDGHFEQSCAAIPVILNIVDESRGIVSFKPPQEQLDLALKALLARQFSEEADPLFAGGLDELGDGTLCVRSGGYALIWLLKHFGGDRRFLSC